MPLILKYLELEMLLVSWKLCSIYFRTADTRRDTGFRCTTQGVHISGGQAVLTSVAAICHPTTLFVRNLFFFFNRGLRRERKDSARTFSANCVYYCCHFAHFSFLSVKLRKLKWFPKYLEVFGSQRLKTIAGKCWNKWQESKKAWTVGWRLTGPVHEDEQCSQPPPLRVSRADYQRKWR